MHDALFDLTHAHEAEFRLFLRASLLRGMDDHGADPFRGARRIALLDAAHWATEWPWCELAASQLDEISDRRGWDLRVHVSRTVTDPWTAHAASDTTSSSMGAPN